MKYMFSVIFATIAEAFSGLFQLAAAGHAAAKEVNIEAMKSLQQSAGDIDQLASLQEELKKLDFLNPTARK